MGENEYCYEAYNDFWDSPADYDSEIESHIDDDDDDDWDDDDDIESEYNEDFHADESIGGFMDCYDPYND